MDFLNSTTFSLERINTLLQFAQAQGVSAVARKQNAKETKISNHLRELEEAFKCKIVDNSGKAAVLTPEGKRLVSLFREHLAELKGFRDEHDQLSSVSIGAGDSLIHTVIIPKFERLKKAFPNTTIHISDMSSEEIKQALRGSKIELGFLTSDLVDTQMGSKPLGNYRYCLVASRQLIKSGEETEEDVLKLPMALIKSHWGIDFIEEANRYGMSINKKVICDNFSQAGRLAWYHCYAAIMPAFAKESFPESEYLWIECPSFLKDVEFSVKLAWDRRLPKMQPKMERFIDTAAEIFRVGD